MNLPTTKQKVLTLLEAYDASLYDPNHYDAPLKPVIVKIGRETWKLHVPWLCCYLAPKGPDDDVIRVFTHLHTRLLEMYGFNECHSLSYMLCHQESNVSTLSYFDLAADMRLTILAEIHNYVSRTRIQSLREPYSPL